MKIRFSKSTQPKSGVVVIFAAEGMGLEGPAEALNKALEGKILKAAKAARFDAKRDQILDILEPGNGIQRLLVAGLGKTAQLTAREIELLGGTIAGALQSAKADSAVILAPSLGNKELSDSDAAALLASGAALRVYNFAGYKSKKPEKTTKLESLTFLCAKPDQAKANSIAS